MTATNKHKTSFGWQITLAQAAQAASVGLAGVYCTGFLVINAYLSKYGVFNFELANLHYLIAGVLFVAFLFFWYMLAGRSTIFSRDNGL